MKIQKSLIKLLIFTIILSIVIPSTSFARWHTDPPPTDDSNPGITAALIVSGVLILGVIIYKISQGSSENNTIDDEREDQLSQNYQSYNKNVSNIYNVLKFMDIKSSLSSGLCFKF